MQQQLGYLRTKMLSPGLRRARVHLLVWGVVLWVWAAGFAIVELIFLALMIIGTALRPASTSSQSSPSIIFIIVLVVLSLPAALCWSAGRTMMRGRHSIAIRSSWGLEKTMKLMNIMLVLGILVFVGGLFLAALPNLGWLNFADAHGRVTSVDAGNIVRILVIGAPLIFLALLFWTYRELKRAMEEL